MKPKDDEKQQAIADATFALVEQAGLSGLTMAAIARQAGIATGTLYVYYKSKEELLNALYEVAKGATIEQVMLGYDAAAPFRGRFQRMWANLVKHRLARYSEAVFQEQYYNSPWFSEASRKLSARFVADWFAIFEDAKTHQILKDVPTLLLVASFMGSVRETASLVRSGGLKRDDASLALAFGICWDGIKY